MILQCFNFLFFLFFSVFSCFFSDHFFHSISFKPHTRHLHLFICVCVKYSYATRTSTIILYETNNNALTYIDQQYNGIDTMEVVKDKRRTMIFPTWQQREELEKVTDDGSKM